jgi:hypothetical protein
MIASDALKRNQEEVVMAHFKSPPPNMFEGAEENHNLQTGYPVFGKRQTRIQRISTINRMTRFSL